MKKILGIALFATLVTQAFASEDIHLTALEKSAKLLEPREGAISLEQAKELAVGDNVDAKMAYQRLYQAHHRISEARATYFPYGTGDVAVLYISNFWNPLILAELITSVPSKWYNVQKQSHLASAEGYRLEALRENVKNQIAKLYYSVLKEEAVLELSGYEVRLQEELLRALSAQVDTGLARVSDLEDAEYSALRMRDQYLRLKSYLAVEKTALKMVLNMSYEEEDLVFQPVKEILAQEDLTFNTENLAITSLNRSYEVKAAQEMIHAAYKGKRSAKWSILSFTGLGFDYMERVRYAGSKIEQAIAEKAALESNIKNEVFARESVLRHSIDITRSQEEISDYSKTYVKSTLAAFQIGGATINELIEANLYFIKDYQKTIVAHYNAYSNLANLERVALGNVEGEFHEGQIHVSAERIGNHLNLDVNAIGINHEVESVTYTFPDMGISDVKRFSARGGFEASISLAASLSPIQGHVIVIFKNGEAIRKPFQLSPQVY